MNNPYLDATFLYQSMTKSATFKTSETRKDKSRSRLPRAFINRLRSKDGSTTSAGSKADSPSLSEPELKIKFKMDGDKSTTTTTASSPPSSPLIDSRSKREKKKENNRKEKEKKENNKKEKKNAAAAAASAKKGGKGADKAIAELEAKLKKPKKKGKKAKKSESESESDSDTESEDGSDSESDGSDSDDSRGYAKGKLRIRKQRSISMNSLLQDFFIKMDQQAQEPALSLVVTPPSSRSPTIGAASSDFDRQYSLTESGSGESNVLLLTRSQAAMRRARDGVMGVSLLATDELDTESDDRSSSLSTKHSSGSGSFPITPTRRGLHGVAMGRSDDGVVLPGGHTAGPRLASSASAAPGKVGGLEADCKQVTTRLRKKTKPKTQNEGEEEEDDEAEGFYVGTGVDMEEDDDVGEDSFGCWSDDATTSATAKTRTAAAKAGVDPSTSDQTDRVVADSSGTMEDQEETNFYGGFVESGSDSSSDSDSDGDDDSSDSSSNEQATNYVKSGQPNGFEEVLATFAKQYLHILEDGKQLAKSDEQEELKEVLQLRTLQQLQELSLQLIKSTQPKLVDPHATPMKVTRSAPVASAAATVKSPSPKGKRRKPPNTGYGKCMDWNGTFQDILWVNEGDDRSLIDRYHALKDLAHDFNHAARTYATIIIEEAFLPDHQKTIPPIHSLGGRAGGEKYVHAGILFKFATDARGIYSGDEFAMKAAGHELKGLINFYKVHHFGICVPLMTIIDYRGFRLVAQALLPIGDDTLVYGSSDAGVNVRTDSREIEKALAAACYELNLAKHAVYPKHGPPVAMYGPGDMEGHFGLDGRYYLIDFARVFPPETPESGTKGAFLYRLLRPELVVRNGVALSSDSFSRFGGPTMDLREPHDTNTKNATDVLVEELVPQFAQWLDKQYNRAFPDYVHRSSSSFGEFLLPGSSSIASPSGDDTIGSPESAEDGLETSGSFFSVMDSDRLPGLGDMDDWASPIIQELHRMGINVRYLGLARSRCMHEVAKMVLLSEMVCRVVKNLLRERLRERMRALRTMAEEPYKEVILELFNLLLGDPTGAAERWWTYDIKTEISKRFKHALTVEELEPTYDLRRSALVPYPALFVRLQLQTAVRLTPEAINDLKNGELTSLVSADIRGQGVNGKDMNIVSTAEAIALAIRCLDGATSAREADRLLRLAIRKFEKAIGRMPGDMELINYYANFLFRKVSTFVHHGMGASGPSPGSRRTTRGRRRKSRVASDEFATWAEDKWDGGDGPDDFGDFDDDEENHYWEERRASSNSAAAAAAGPTHASSTNSNANANAFVGLTSGLNPLDLSGHKLKLHRSGSNNISGTSSGANDDDVASPATTTTTTTTTNVNAAAAKWAESLRWHITLLSKMLKLFKTCENFVMLNILADLCKQFATNLQQMDRDLKRAYARKLRCFAAAKQKAHQSLATSAPAGFGGGGGQSQSASNLSSSASPSKHHHGSGVGKSQLTASLPGLPLAGGHTSHASALAYERSLRRNEVLVERERDRRRDLLHSYQLQALYLTNECYTAITVIESAPLLDFVQSTMGGGLTALRPQKTTSAPALRPSSMPMPLSLTTSATLPTLTARPASHMSAAPTADRVDDDATSAAQRMTSAGSSDEYHIMKEKRSSIGMHIYPHRSASFIGKKMMPFVYFRWAELLYLRAHILEKKTRLEKQIRLTEVAEGLRSEEDEARWEKEKREEVEYLRYYSGKRYRDAFQILDNTESRNIVQRNDDEPKLLAESNGARTASGEKKDARRWVMSAYPTNSVKENIALASIMELYRCNLEKHGRWGALSGRRSEEDPGPHSKERRGGSDAKKEDDNESGGGGEPQEKRAKTKKEKKEAKTESGGSAKKKKKHGGKKRGGGEEAETKNEKSEAADVVVESDRARRRREREEAEKALLMQEMKKAKDVARNKNKIQRPDDEDDDNDTGDARKLRIVVDEDVLKDEPTTTPIVDDSKSDTATKKNEKTDGGRKAKTKAKEGGSHGGGGKSSPAEAPKEKEKDNRHYGPRARQAPKKAPSISAQLRSQKLKTFDDDWLPAECLSDDLFLSVVKNCPVQEVILGADAARRTHKDSVMMMLSTSRETNLPGAGATKGGKRRGGSPSSENLYIERRERRSVQVVGVDDIDIGRHSSAASSWSHHQMSTRDGGGGVATSFASTRRVLTSPFASSSSATLPAPGSFATRSFSSSNSAPRGSGIGGGGSASVPPAISVDALQKAAASGSFNELTHLTLKRYEEITDAQLESILRIQYTTLTSLRLEGCLQLSDKTLQHLASSLFGPHLRHVSFKNCPRITNRGVLDLVKTTTSLVSLCLDGCEKISNKPIIYLAKGCPSLRHLSLMGCKKISDKSITEIANHTTNLASLRVSSERVTDASLVLMGKKLPQLYSLTMANCNITNEGLQAVCWGVAASQLTHLCFVECDKIGGKEQLLFNVVHRCPNLLYLHVKKSSPPAGKK